MNPFQLDYVTLLTEWANLRQQISNQPLSFQCQHTDRWWQQAPLVNHHLHLHDRASWPNPWELLSNNTYCTVARGLGMCYTLHLSGITDIELANVTDDHGYEHVLVLVDNAKYLLNWWPDTVLNINLSDFTVKDRIDITSTLQKIK